MEKILFCASTASHLINFHLPYIEALSVMGYEVHALVNERMDIPHTTKVWAVPFTKSLFAWDNLKSIELCRKLLKKEHYTMLVTNTALAGIVVRTAAMMLRRRPKIVHIAGGYLFRFSFSAKKLIYLLPEKLVAGITNTVITLNEEDYCSAQKHQLFKRNLVRVNGLGANLTKFFPLSQAEKFSLREEYGIEKDKLVFVFAGEFNKGKNQKFLIETFCELQALNIELVLLGTGVLYEQCRTIVQNSATPNMIQLPGFSKEVWVWYQMADIAISASCSEGLPFNIIEAMACGLPIVASDIKGHRELVRSGENGYLYPCDDKESLKAIIREIANEHNKLIRMGKKSRLLAPQFSLERVKEELLTVYRDALSEL